MTKLVIPITVSVESDLSAAFAAARAAAADAIELRLDYLPDLTPALCRRAIEQARHAGLTVIATLRTAADGGRFTGHDHLYHTLLDAIRHAAPDYLDLELSTWQRLSDERRRTLAQRPPAIILSTHDFDSLPDDLPARLDAIRHAAPAIVKFAYAASDAPAVFPALDALHRRPPGENLIALAMGEPGLITRLAARKLNAWCTFASLAPGRESAPGQPAASQIRSLYRWNQIDPHTRLFAVLGSPVAHSMSPALHNAAFEAARYPGLFLPMPIHGQYPEFAAFLTGLRQRPWLDFRGLSITLPHKANALRYLREHDLPVDPLAARIGAVNTLTFLPEGRLQGHNTDYTGALAAIAEKLPNGLEDLRHAPVAIVGAGGVARALVAGLTDLHARVTIYNRTLDRAAALAEEFHATAAPLDQLPDHHARLLVNCTSLGMTPDTDSCPAPPAAIRPDMLVFDTVYNPPTTRLLQLAQQAGATPIDGISMFIHQAAAQQKLWTNHHPDLNLLRTTTLNQLTPSA